MMIIITTFGHHKRDDQKLSSLILTCIIPEWNKKTEKENVAFDDDMVEYI